MIKRTIIRLLNAALSDTPVVLINGPRQAGKSTLAQDIARLAPSSTYLTFDEMQILTLARANPEEFLTGYSDGLLVLDEVQRAPEIFLGIKLLVDRNRKPGKFLLTGSANVMLLPKIAESLAGRMEIMPLWPFSQTEILESEINFVDLIFSEKSLLDSKVKTATNFWQSVLIGGYPEVLTRKNESRRRSWFSSYISSILLRDVRDLANIEGLTELPNLFSILAARAGNLLNFAELSRSIRLPQTTLKRYMTLLQTTFLISLLKPWSMNINKRFVKAPKIMLNDTGLLSHLLGINIKNLQQQQIWKGPILENFVFTELYKQNTWSKAQAEIFHFRTHGGEEVDLLFESNDKRLVGVEVKAARSVSPQDFNGLKLLAELKPKQFHRGIVLYTGDKIIPYGKKMIAIPVNAIFS